MSPTGCSIHSGFTMLKTIVMSGLCSRMGTVQTQWAQYVVGALMTTPHSPPAFLILMGLT